ncbi:ABC transporter permease [Clostridium baratii]|uniref:ABC transporter permease n=1 Tax=Clostridium baratii TaxID=1561 RepID=UPI002432868C|nr:ABC transporter permease subunit [Clostridium baratii]MBS6043142.1 ABC transporter permease subunit [Clostridium baratii]
MLFTLVKNELIKISRRSKTWIVFGLFTAAIIGFICMGKVSANQMEHWNSPQGRIENMNHEISWIKEDINRSESQIKDGKLDKETTNNIKEQINYNKERIKELEGQIKIQEKKIESPETVDWREEIKGEITDLKAQIKEAESIKSNENKDVIKSLEEQISQKQYYLDNNIEPIENWEFFPSNLASQIMMILGMGILVAGIAVFMSDIVSGECTPATVKFLLVQPVSRAKVLLSKFIAIVLTVVSMICGVELAAFGIVGAFTGFDAAKMPVTLGQKYIINQEVLIKEGFKQLDLVAGSGYQTTMGDLVLKGFLLQILFIIACCAFIFMISSLFKSSMITMAVSVIISVAAVMLPSASSKIAEYAHLSFLSYGNTPAILMGDIAFVYQNVNFSLQLGIGLMIGTIIISYIIAHFVFTKRDMLA